MAQFGDQLKQVFDFEGDTLADKVSDTMQDVTDISSNFGNQLQDWGKSYNDKAIEFAKTLDQGKQQSGEIARENLTRGKISGMFSDFGYWIQKPKNMGITGVIVLLIILMLRR